MKTSLAVVLLLAALSACNTTPVSLSDARPIPNERLLAFQKSTTRTGTITAIRDEGIIASACYLGLFINDTLAARFDVAEFANFHVESGEVLLRVGWDPQGNGLCSTSAPSLSDYTQRETLLKINEKKRFRLSIDLNGKLDVQRAE